jgi:hypothetical protein
VENLGATELVVIARTTRVLQVEAEKVLYRQIVWGFEDLDKAASCCESLQLQPWRPEAVQLLSVSYNDGWRSGATMHASTPEKEKVAGIITTVQNLPSIVDLTLYGSPPFDWLPIGKCRFTLRSFLCENPDDHVLRFIETQPQIRQLRLSSFQYPSETYRRCPTTSVPCLENIRAYPEMLAYFVPHHPVKTVWCNMYFSAARLQDVLDTLKLSTGPVVSCTIMLRAPSNAAKPFHAIAMALPFLQHLDVRFQPGMVRKIHFCGVYAVYLLAIALAFRGFV